MRAVALGWILLAEAAFAQSPAVDELLRTGRFVEAESRLREAARTSPTADTKAALAISLAGQFRYGEAEPLITEACERNPRKESWWMVLAKCQFERGQSLLAAKSLDIALKIKETSDILDARATCSLQASDMKSGEAFLRRALVLTPDHVGALLRLASILVDRGNYAEASPLAQTAARLRVDSSDAWFLLCMCERKAGRHLEALAAADRVLTQLPGHAGALQQRVSLLRLLGRHTEALHAVAALKVVVAEDDLLASDLAGLRLDATNVMRRCAIASRAIRLGRHDVAEDQLRAIAALSPSHAALPELRRELDQRRLGATSRPSGTPR